MEKRDIKCIAAGVACGLIIGAVSTVATGVSTTASTTVRHYAYQLVNARKDAAEYQNMRRVRSAAAYVRAEDPMSAERLYDSAPEKEVVVEAKTYDACAPYEKLKADVLSVIPGDAWAQAVRMEVMGALEKAVVTCTMKEARTMRQGDRTTGRRIPSIIPSCMHPIYCHRYSGTRRTHCIKAQEEGQCYQPQQTKQK